MRACSAFEAWTCGVGSASKDITASFSEAEVKAMVQAKGAQMQPRKPEEVVEVGGRGWEAGMASVPAGPLA